MIQPVNVEPADNLPGNQGASSTTPQGSALKSFMAVAMRRFRLCAEAEAKVRGEALKDLKFRVGEQWDEFIMQDRINARKPTLTINKVDSLCSQIVNEQRSQRPGLQVNPVGSKTDIDTAQVLQGVLRHIEVQSDAELAYDNAMDSMVSTGKGYWEIYTDYIAGLKTFDQEIYIGLVKNRFTVYCDPDSVLPDESDAEYKFQIQDMPRDTYMLKFPGSRLASLKSFKSVGDNAPGWATSKTIRIAKYWVKERVERDLVKLADGTVFFAEQVPEKLKDQIQATRKFCQVQVRCYLINAIEILEMTQWPGRVGFIPLIPIIGNDYDVNGERVQYGIIRNAKDPQKMYNVWRSAATEMIALAPKAPFVGWEGQFTDKKWRTANTANHAYLEAHPVSVQGQPTPTLPQRQNVEPPIQAILAMNAGADMDFKAVTGVYEPSLGQQKNDQSGKAIGLLQQQGQLTNFNYTDNLTRALKHTGRVILDILPFIYDAPRVQRIIKPDDSTSQVVVHSGRGDAAQELANPGNLKVFDISTGVYDVTVSVGPSFQTQRQQTEQAMLSLIQADPQLLQVGGDILLSNMDWPGAQELSQRLKKLVNPDLLDNPEDQTDPKTQAAQAVARTRQLQQQNTVLMQQNQKLSEQMRTKMNELQAQVYMAQINAASRVEVAGLQAKLDAAKLDFEKWEAAHAAADARATAATGEQNAGNNNQQSDNAGQGGSGGSA